MRSIFISFFVFTTLLIARIDSYQKNPDVSDTILSDSTQLSPDSSKIPVKTDSLTYHSIRPFYEKSIFISDSVIQWNDYRGITEQLTGIFPGFKRSLGYTGQLSEVIVYGAEQKETGFFRDGAGINSRGFNFIDFNSIQEENTDSLEFVPLPRGFTNGFRNNLVSINQITKFLYARIPYTRIRYYEGPYEEGYLNFQLHQMITPKISFAVDVTNRADNIGYDYTDAGTWNIGASSLYLYSQNISFEGRLLYTKSQTDLNGGVNYALIASRVKNIDSVLFSPLIAPVMYSQRYEKYTRYNYLGGVRYSAGSSFSGRTFVNYDYRLREYRQNERADSLRLVQDFFDKGVSFESQNTFTFGSSRLNLNFGYEASSFNTRWDIHEYNSAVYLSTSISASFARGKFSPSLFGKFLSFRNMLLPGAGFDITIILSENFELYSGISHFKSKPYNDIYLSEQYRDAYTTFETRLKYSFEGFSGLLSVYYYRSTMSKWEGAVPLTLSGIDENNKPAVQGIGGFINSAYRNGYFLQELCLSIHTSEKNESESVPLYSGNAGFYYTGVHFDSSLNIKTGFRLNASGALYAPQIDFFTGSFYRDSGRHFIPGVATIDFYTAGEIKKSAIVYFIWENLLDKKYYLQPYYPMPRRGIRFGIAWELFN